MKTYAVIPAAGRGSRLQLSVPKILAPLTKTKTVWSVMRERLAGVDHIHVIASPSGERCLGQVMDDDRQRGFVSISIQSEPIGMGDALFQGYPVWSQADRILVVWGDQVGVSDETLQRALALHAGRARTVALPLIRMAYPYVDYIFDEASRLTAVHQSREGDHCPAEGLSDVGTFVLSVPELFTAWTAYVKQAHPGVKTNELNFLPFLPFLAANGWDVQPVPVDDPIETRGINTPEDLSFFQQCYQETTA